MENTLLELSLNDIKAMIKEEIENKIAESFSFDDEPDARLSFDDVQENFDSVLKEKLPEHEFEYDVEPDGEVTVRDMTTGKWYKGYGEIEHEMASMNRPNPKNPYIEDESLNAYYDFTDALNEILKKIDEDRPDEIDEP